MQSAAKLNAVVAIAELTMPMNWGRGALAAHPYFPEKHASPVPFHPRLIHLLPVERQPLVYLTVVTRDRHPFLANAETLECLTAIWQRSPEIDGWFVGDFLTMPDHVHLFARRALDAKSLAQWVGSWKSLSARRLSAALKIKPPFWQRDYFDRFIRSNENYRDKWEYAVANPVRQGLCATPDDWPWKGRLFDLRY